MEKFSEEKEERASHLRELQLDEMVERFVQPFLTSTNVSSSTTKPPGLQPSEKDAIDGNSSDSGRVVSSVKPSTSINKPQPRLRSTFPSAETMAVSAEEKDLFYGGPVPLKLDVKEKKAFKIYEGSTTLTATSKMQMTP